MHAARGVHRSQRRRAVRPTMRASDRTNAQGDANMFDELLAHIEILAASLAGGCFAVWMMVG
jgi:hypothetical protein